LDKLNRGITTPAEILRILPRSAIQRPDPPANAILKHRNSL